MQTHQICEFKIGVLQYLAYFLRRTVPLRNRFHPDCRRTDDTAAFEKELRAALASIADRYPGLNIEPSGEKEWHVIVPDALVKTHETRFSSVMKVYLQYLIDGKIPDWEVSQMKAKYYTTTAALEAARAAK